MWQFVKGCVIIQCTGRNLPRFLNLLRSNGVRVSDARSLPEGGMRLTVPARDFARIRPLVRQSACRVHIVSRGGLPFLLWRIQRRPVLWIGMAITVCAMLFLSTRIVHIRVEGIRRLPEELVLRALSEQGVERFGAYPNRNLEDIASMMRLYDERIAWVSLALSGNCLRVDVTETEPSVSTVDSDTPCDVVAVKDGVIKKLEVYEGHSTFSVGDAVSAGDVVITGEFFPETNEVVEAPMRVHARGSVEAEVYYFSEYAAEPTETVLLDSGNSVPYRKITLWGMTLSQTEIPYAEYEIRHVVTRPFAQSVLPVMVAEGLCYELTEQTRDRTRAEQIEFALTCAEQLAYLKIPKDAEIVDKRKRTTVSDRVVIAVVCIITRETIGLSREISG